MNRSNEDRLLKRLEARRFLQSELRNHMTAFGFAAKGTTFSLKLNQETTLVSSLQVLGGQAPLLGLFPHVGFINWKIVEFFRVPLQWPIDGSPRTLGTLLGYLMPKPLQVEWFFEPTETAIRQAAQTVTQNVMQFGMPFMSRYPDLHALSEWATNPAIEPHATFIQPTLLRAIILHLTGKQDEAKKLISDDILTYSAAGYHLDDPNYQPTLRLNGILTHGAS